MTCKVSPQPRTPAIAIALTIAQGTAVAALDASSLICTLESKEPGHRVSVYLTEMKIKFVQIVHRGARKLKINAYPSGQPLTG